MANQNEETKHKCLRHQLKPEKGDCAMCAAKREAQGKFEKARRIFVLKKK